MFLEYGSNLRYGAIFASRSLLGDENDRFFKKNLREQADEMAWREGCPIKDEVIGRNGERKSINRYGDIIMTTQVIVDMAMRKKDAGLYGKLLQGEFRGENQPVGKHEPQSVPDSHKTYIAPFNCPWGFSVPRMLIYMFEMGVDKQTDKKCRTEESMLAGYNLLEKSIKEAKTPQRLIILVAKKALSLGVDRDLILKSVLSRGYLREQKTYKQYSELLKSMERSIPELFLRYTSLTREEKRELGIAELN